MKNIFRILTVVTLVMALSVPVAQAGNDTRRGTAGAQELLLNPWARSAGWGSVNVANSRGLESFYTNIAGLSFVKSTELTYSYSALYSGKGGLMGGGNVNAFGLAQRIFEKGVAGVYVMTLGFGDIPVTTVEDPEGKGVFTPTLMNINVAYSHSFTRSIHGGVNIKLFTETTSDVTGTGFGIDAGIQYVTGENDELKFGISLKNVGTGFSFDGTGLSFTFENEHENNMTVQFRRADNELPTCMNIGASYDFLFEKWDQRLTVAGAFTSNAFLKDNFGIGVEYSVLNRVQLRCGYVAQKNIFSSNNRTTANVGLSAGASVELPLSKKDGAPTLVLDYSYRAAQHLRGTHSLGLTIRL